MSGYEVASLVSLESLPGPGSLRWTPVVVRAATPESGKAALARPEVACVLVPTEELLALDLTTLTYG